jgi:ribosomal protein S12 methylthiotransferase accessory factor YcaO
MGHMHEKPLPSPSILFDGQTVTDNFARWEAAMEHIEYLSEPVYGFDENYDPLPPEFGSDLDNLLEPDSEIPF